MDPHHPEIVWAASGYGANGVWKSVNGGVDFENMLNAEAKAAIDPRPQYTANAGFIEKITLESRQSGARPRDVPLGWFLHPRRWNAERQRVGLRDRIGERRTTWSTVAMPVFPGEGSGQTMIDAKTWYYGGESLWRTADAGATWKNVFDLNTNGSDAGGRCLPASDGTFYVPQNNQMARSTDGITWKPVPNTMGAGTVNGARRIVDDGKRVITSSANTAATRLPTGGSIHSHSTRPRTSRRSFRPKTG